MQARTFLALVCLGLAAALVPVNAHAQTARTIRIIVPYTPGSGPDILSRLMGNEIGHAQGANVVVENRPGGGTIVGTELAARADPDGSTVLLVANSFVINPALKRQTYDVTASFEPVCYLAATPMVLVVKSDSPYRTLADLLAAARQKPGELSLASGGPGSSLHIAFEVVLRAANVTMTYVPYGGTAPAINALMGGHVTAVFADYPTVVAQLKSGTLRALATASRTRVATLPEVPTLAETGVVTYDADIFYGIVVPAKTPAATTAQLVDFFSSALKTPEMPDKLAQQGLFPVGMCGPPFGEFMRKQVEDYGRIIREANMKAE